MKDTNNLIKITCPYCGHEYLPSEIYIPKSFFGNQTNIERTYNGKILDFDGKDMDLKEVYKCDNCDNTFYINSQIKFSSSKVEDKYDFDTDYISELKIKKYSLFEDQ